MGSSNHSEEKLVANKFEVPAQIKTISFAFVAIGLLGFVVGLMRDQDRLWTSYLTAFFYVSCIGIGGLFFAAINNIAKAGWSVSIRRLSEGFTSFLPVVLIGSLVLWALGLKHLYTWTDPELIANNAIVASKTAYLNKPFMLIRLLIFGIGSLFFAYKLVGNSVKQDTDGREEYTHKNVGLSVAFILFFALSFSLFSVDLLMTLLPTWYSTIFGVYCFAGMFQSTAALLILVMLYMRKQGVVSGYFTIEHVHDVAKYLKGFTIFWAYIAFSQFMLIWYANIPEETEYYLLRAHGGWLTISMALLVFKFIVPFLALLPRAAKRNPSHLVLVCSLILVMQYVDVYWMVYPNFNGNHVVFGFYEVAMLLLFVGLFLLTLGHFYKTKGVVALKDPRMHEATHHHVAY